jgi:hypothetical protein
MKNSDSKPLLFLSYFSIVCVLLMRIEGGHPLNFVPVFACLLLFAAARPARESVLPFTALVGVDIFLTRVQYGYPLTADHAVTWLWYGATILVGLAMLRRPISISRGLTASLLASLSFFFASNFAVWAAWGMYPKTWSGLADCYIAALPFFRNSVVSEAIGSAILFGIARYFCEAAKGRRIEHVLP